MRPIPNDGWALEYVGETERGTDRFREVHHGLARASENGASDIFFAPIAGVVRRRALESIIRYEFYPACNTQPRPSIQEYFDAKSRLASPKRLSEVRRYPRPPAAARNALIDLMPGGFVPPIPARSEIVNALLAIEIPHVERNESGRGLLGTFEQGPRNYLAEIASLLSQTERS
tara:strand:+ start:1365 stop:1886 length:522 start_codon:yes stop_codon:yes gene_type:complete